MAAGDPVATSELFTYCHHAVAAAVRRKFPSLTVELALDLSTDAIVSYLQSPDRFDPARTSLFSWLCMIAKRDAINLVTAESRKKKYFRRFVELQAADGNVIEHKGDRSLDARRIIEQHLPDIADDESDIMVLTFILEGERDTGVIADALGLANLPDSEKRQEVKRRRDRIEKRLERLGERLR